MKKRSLGMVIALVVAFSLLAVTAYASTPTYEGYEAFKTLAKNMEGQDEEDVFKQENARVSAELIVIDNEEIRVQMETDFKVEGEDNASGTFKITHADVTKEVKVYAENEKLYVLDVLEDTYYMADRQAMRAEYNQADDDDETDYKYSRDYTHGDMTKAQEELIDFVMADLKDDFELEYNSDGSETIYFELTKEEMPILLNLFVSAANGQEKTSDAYEEFRPDAILLDKYPILKDFVNMKDYSPEIVNNIELDYVQLALTRQEDVLSELNFDFKLSGEDEAGVQHNVQIKGALQVSEIGTTLADKVELDGQDIIEIEPEDFEEFDGNRRVHGRR